MGETIQKQSGMLAGTPIDEKYLLMSAKRDQLARVEKGYIERHSGKALASRATLALRAFTVHG